MQPFQQIYDEHAELLINRGYDESATSSPQPKGQLLGELRRNLSNCVHKLDAEDKPVGFSLQTLADFKGNGDRVKIDLHYLYNPQEVELKLYRLDLRWGDHHCTINLNTSFHLPTARSAFGRIEREALRSEQHQGKPLKMVIPKSTRKLRGL